MDSHETHRADVPAATGELPWQRYVAGSPPSTPVRVFVGGCERSGTTFLAAQISRWAGLVFLPESYFLLPVLRAVARGAAESPRTLILNNWRVDTFGLSRERMGERLTDAMSPLECMDELAKMYAEKIGQADFAGWVEHTPFNTANIDLLSESFPDARHVNVVRDGRAVAASVLRTDFGPATVSRAALWWKANTLPGLLAQIADPKGVLLVRYEDLVHEEAECRRRVIGFLGLTEDGACDVPVRVDRYFEKTHALVSGSAVSSRADAWRTDLSQRQIELFESHAAGSLASLGYEPVFGVRARESRYYRYFDALIDAFLSLFWQVPRRVLRRYLSALRRNGDG